MQVSNSAQRNHTLLIGASVFHNELLPLAGRLRDTPSSSEPALPDTSPLNTSLGAGFVLGLECLYRAARAQIGDSFSLEEIHLLDQV